MRKKKYDRPVLCGTVAPDKKTISVWCPHCQSIHMHGWDGEVSHRVAHCVTKEGDAALPRGYYVAPMPKIKRLD